MVWGCVGGGTDGRSGGERGEGEGYLRILSLQLESSPPPVHFLMLPGLAVWAGRMHRAAHLETGHTIDRGANLLGSWCTGGKAQELRTWFLEIPKLGGAKVLDLSV